MRQRYQILGGTAALFAALVVGCNNDPTTLGTGGPSSGAGTGSGGDATGTGGSTASNSSSSASNSSSSSSSTTASSSSTASGQGGSNFMSFAAPNVDLQDVNNTSTLFGQDVSAVTFANQVSGWFFGHST